jgi:glycosyltransferase involved in cell wall biosynthesis
VFVKKNGDAVTVKTAALRRQKSICFVSETARVERPMDDPSVLYRCYRPAEVLLSEGYDCTVTSAAHFYANPTLRHDVYVFHRPNAARANFARVQGEIRKSGAVLIADYDDLIFGDERLALVSSAVVNRTLTEEKAIKSFSSNLAALLYFDKVIASTEPLVERVREYNHEAESLQAPNMVPPSILSIHKENGTPFLPRPRTNIGYFAGTRSHDKDLSVVEEALHRVLCENPGLNLFVVGPVSMPPSLSALANVITAPVVSLLRLPGLMTMCSTVIAPLDVSHFNACKSRVKFLEAALAGCRLIASPIPDMCAVGPEHITLADNLDVWYEALSEPLDNEARKSLALRNFEHLENSSYNTSLKFLAGIE